MTRYRAHTLGSVHDALGDVCLAWAPYEKDTPLRSYSAKRGVEHLLVRARTDDAEARMLGLHFMAAYANAWGTVVEPLAAWRVVGLERAREGYARVAAEMWEVGACLEDSGAACDVSGFLRAAGLYKAGIPLAEWALRTRETLLGAVHEATLRSLRSVGGLYRSMGRYADALPLLDRSLEASERTLGPEHPDTLTSVNNLGVLYKSQGRYDEAEPLLLRAREAHERTLGPDHPSTLVSVNNLAWLQLEHTATLAAPLFDRCLAAWTYPADWKHHWARLGRALCDVLRGEATEPADGVVRDLEALLGADHKRVAKARAKVVRVVARRKERL